MWATASALQLSSHPCNASLALPYVLHRRACRTLCYFGEADSPLGSMSPYAASTSCASAPHLRRGARCRPSHTMVSRAVAPESHEAVLPPYHLQTRVGRFTSQKNHTRGAIMLREEEDSAHAACTITTRKTRSARVHAKTEH
jgi:hypothetical protein